MAECNLCHGTGKWWRTAWKDGERHLTDCPQCGGSGQKKAMMVGEHPVSPFGRTEAVFDEDYWEQKAKMAQFTISDLTAALAAADARCREAQERVIQAEEMEGAAARFLSAVWINRTEPSNVAHQLAAEAFDALRDIWLRRLDEDMSEHIGDVVAAALAEDTDDPPRAPLTPPPDTGGTATPGREQMLVSLIREVLDREPVYLHDGATSNDDTCCVFCDAAMHSDVDDGNPHEADCWIVRADAVVNAYSPDAGGAKEQGQVARLRSYLWRIRDAVMHEGGWCYDYETAEGKRIADAVNAIWREARDAGDHPFATPATKEPSDAH